MSVVDSVITGLHESDSSHIDMIEALAGSEILKRGYRVANDLGYMLHEFGDMNLIL